MLSSGFDDGKALSGSAFSGRLYTALKTLAMRGDVDRVLSNVGFVAASPDSGEFDFSTELDFGDVVFCAERNCGRRLAENMRAVFEDARLAPVLRVGILAGIQYALNRHSKFTAPASFNSRNPRRAPRVREMEK